MPVRIRIPLKMTFVGLSPLRFAVTAGTFEKEGLGMEGPSQSACFDIKEAKTFHIRKHGFRLRQHVGFDFSMVAPRR